MTGQRSEAPGGGVQPRAGGRGLLLVAMAAFPAALLVVRELSIGSTIWNFRTVDLADLILLSPLIILILAALLYHLLRYEVAMPVLGAFAAFSFVFVFGQAMHWAANSIDTFALEVNDYGPVLPDDLESLIFFIDERLSHAILFVAAAGLISTWLVADELARFPSLLGEQRWVAVVIGILYGGLIAFSVIEARMVWMVVPMTLVPLGVGAYFWRQSGLPSVAFLHDRQFRMLVAVMAVAALVLTAAYGIAYGGFPQPSEL